MKVLVIPDIHLKPFIFYDADILMKKGIAERAVCLMDIPDDWNQQYNLQLYTDTFHAAVDFARKYPDTLWCYGNHDLSYIWGAYESGYSDAASWLVKNKLQELKDVLPDKKQIQYIHRIDNVVFCHGGIMEYFVENIMGLQQCNDTDDVLRRINTLSYNLMWDDSSPIWFRPQYLKGKMYQANTLLQVVGHTPVETIIRTGNLISCDVFSTYRDGRPIGTSQYLLLDTVTWEYAGVKP